MKIYSILAISIFALMLISSFAFACTPNTQYCKNNNVTSCSSDGLREIFNEDCTKNGQVCVQDNPDDSQSYVAWCETVIVCMPNSYSCIGNNIYKCNAQGNNWVWQKNCNQATEKCEIINSVGVCSPLPPPVCTPDTYQCSGTQQVQKCNAQGTAWVNYILCPTERTCQASGATYDCILKPDCAAIPSIGVPDSSIGDKYCMSSNPNAYNECTPSDWISNVCPAGTICYQQGKTIQCGPDTSTPDCAAVPSIGLPDSYVGDQYCYSTNPNAYNECTPSDWISKTCPDSTDTCSQISSNKVNCLPQAACIENSFRCSPTDSALREKCLGGNWAGYESCLYDCNMTTNECNSVPGGLSLFCTPENNFCNGNILTYCENNQWKTRSCVPEGKICSGAGASAACVSGTLGGSGYVPGASGIPPELYSTGGGEVARCTSWSEWYVNKSATKIEKEEKSSRECTDAILMRYCYSSTGILDFSHYESTQQYTCGEWSDAEKCDYVFESSSASSDVSGEKCRTCENAVYVYTCQPSGKADYSNTKKSTSCSSWRQCTAAEAAGANVKPQRSELDALVEDYGLVIGAVVVVLLLVVLFATYKMFSGASEG